MIRTIVFRLFIGCISIFFLVVIALVSCGWLATQPPEFYTRLLERNFSKEEQLQSEAHFKQLGFALEFWAEQSAFAHQTNSIEFEKAIAAATGASFVEFAKLVDDAGQVVIDQDSINAILSAEDESANEIQKFRVQLTKDRIKLAGELVIPDLTNLYISAELRPSMNSDGKLKLDLLSGRIGRLPIPIQTILQWLPQEFTRHQDDVQINAYASPANIILDFSDPAQRVPPIKHIGCQEQKLLLRFEPAMNSF